MVDINNTPVIICGVYLYADDSFIFVGIIWVTLFIDVVNVVIILVALFCVMFNNDDDVNTAIVEITDVFNTVLVCVVSEVFKSVELNIYNIIIYYIL